MSEILVIGHRNPDPDAICSAIGYAEFKRRTGLPHAVAARCGDTNDRIDFVLKTFGMPPPRFVADVSPKVRDVMQANVVTVMPHTTVAEALGIMDDRNIRVLPVLGEGQRCAGLLSVFKMSKFFFPSPNRLFDSRRVLASINHLAATLNAEVLYATNPEPEEDLILMIGAMSLGSFAQRLIKARAKVDCGGRRSCGSQKGHPRRVRVVIVTSGLAVADGSPRRAPTRSACCAPPRLRDDRDAGAGGGLIDHMVRGVPHVSRGQSLAEVRGVATVPASTPSRLDEEGRLIGILSKSDFGKVDRQLILVDHNELSKRCGATAGDLEVVDHHASLFRLNSRSCSQRAVGSTSTIVADCFRPASGCPNPSPGCCLRDWSPTRELTSPTRPCAMPKSSPGADRHQRAGVHRRLFASGSVLTTKPAADAITADCKEYTEDSRSFSVAQIEEIGFDQFWKRKDEVLRALEAYRRDKAYFFSALLVTDVVLQTSLLLLTGGAAFVKAIDYPEVEAGIYELAGVVSRKKQLLPYLTHCLEKVR